LKSRRKSIQIGNNTKNCPDPNLLLSSIMETTRSYSGQKGLNKTSQHQNSENCSDPTPFLSLIAGGGGRRAKIICRINKIVGDSQKMKPGKKTISLNKLKC